LSTRCRSASSGEPRRRSRTHSSPYPCWQRQHVPDRLRGSGCTGHPMHVVRRGVVADTAGAGTFRGAPQSTVSLVRSKVYTTKVLYTADGTINSAMGAGRGGRGALAQAQKRGRDGSLTALPACYGVAPEAGKLSCRIRLAEADMARPSSATRAAFCMICARAGLPPSVRSRCMAL
jgi:hypothetical protein